MRMHRSEQKDTRVLNFREMSALVIEDDRATRAVVTKMLKNLEFMSVLEAEDGTVGLEIVETVLPNVVLCDINMEPMDGLQFLNALRTDQDARKRVIPVLFLTSQADADTVKGAMQLGIDGFLKKPVNPQILRERLTKALLAG